MMSNISKKEANLRRSKLNKVKRAALKIELGSVQIKNDAKAIGLICGIATAALGWLASLVIDIEGWKFTLCAVVMGTAASTAMVVFLKPELYEQRLDQLLSSYEPFEVDQFALLIETSKAEGTLSFDALNEWIRREYMAISSAMEKPVKHKYAFMDRKF